MQQAVATAEANKKVAKDNLEAGYMQQADFLSVEIQVNQLKNQFEFWRNRNCKMLPTIWVLS